MPYFRATEMCATPPPVNDLDRQFTLRQADQARSDFAEIQAEFAFLNEQLARLPTRSEITWFGLLTTLGALAAIGAVACTADSHGTDAKEQRPASSRSALSVVPSATQHVAGGEAPGQLGFRPALREAMPIGAPAVAAAPGASGAVLVLDALRERVVRVQKGDDLVEWRRAS